MWTILNNYPPNLIALGIRPRLWIDIEKNFQLMPREQAERIARDLTKISARFGNNVIYRPVPIPAIGVPR